MRRFLATLSLVAIATTAQAGTPGQSPSSGSLTGGAGGVDGACAGGKVVLRDDLGGSGVARNAPTTATVSANSGRISCGMFRAPCTASGYTKISFNITTGLASSVCETGIYDSTGATRIASTGSQSCAASGVINATGLTPFTLVGGTQYLACVASSAVATVVYLTMNTSDALNNAIANTTFAGSSTAANCAPFNEACTAGSTPFTCCTGLGTGTCLGMVDRTGVPGITASASNAPLIVIGP